MDADAARGRVLLEESRESVVVLDPGFTGRALVVVEGPASAMQLVEGEQCDTLETVERNRQGS